MNFSYLTRHACGCAGIAVLLSALFPFVAGCTGSSSTNAPSVVSTDAMENEPDGHELLDSALQIFQLQNLGISSDLERGVSLLNQWRRVQQRLGVTFEPTPDEVQQLSSRVPAEWMPELKRSNYTVRDGEFLRDLLLARALQEHAIGQADSELARVLNIFGFVVRNIQLEDEHPDQIPLSTFETFLFGTGTAADRAWLFADMLRQLKIDAVILSTVEDAGKSGPLLVGVLSGSDVLLFDAQAGIPLPGPMATAANGIQRPATLAEVREHPELLRQLDIDADKPYPLTADHITNPSVQIIASTSLWSDRMQGLQSAFIGDRSMVVCDPLIGADGSFERVARFGKNLWTPEQVTVWKYPDEQLGGRQNPSVQQRQTMQRLIDSWNAPLALQVVKGPPQQIRVTPTRTAYRARIAQVRGKYEDAVKSYLVVQIDSKRILSAALDAGAPVEGQSRPKIDPRVVHMHEKAEDDARFWIGVCKFEQGGSNGVRVAADKCRQYLEEHPQGDWRVSVRYLLANCLADQHEFAKAAEQLGEIPAENPQRFGYHWLAKSWKQAAGDATAASK
ncbi:MAG TPA: tetratricopeptide repeat protein [Planctomycetaceae bacterium]|nr:tetratricopeptide repeat protein [Planctomycetaceae bacterium]